VIDVPILECRFLALPTILGSSALWQDAAAGDLRECVSGSAPEQGTAVSCAWTADDLRVSFRCIDPHPHATITQRDGPLWEEEVVEVFLDPVGDGESYFEIEVNPLNTVLDLVLRRSRSGWKKDFAWDCEGFRSVVAMTADGWNAEMAIPFTAVVGEPPVAGSEWRVNFCRIDRPPGCPRELTAWSPTLSGTFHMPQRFGRLRFVG
jgi:hypothetical protein